MKLLLINPKDTNTSSHKGLQRFIDECPQAFVMKHPSLPLLTLAAITPAGVEIEYVDENARAIDFDAEADLVGIGGMTQQSTRAYEIADRFRARGTKVAIGGIHATVLPDEAAQHADAVVAGEAERSWPQLIRDFGRNKMKARSAAPLADLTKTPVPRYDLVRGFDFSGMPQAFVPIQLTRGCPHNCDFCSVTHVYGRRYRKKTVPQAMREIESLFRDCGIPNPFIKFNDDNPFVDAAFAGRFLKALAPMRIRWFALADIKIANQPKLLDQLREAGCLVLGIGFESIDPASLGEVSRWKRAQVEGYPEAIRRINAHGIGVAGSFMFGFDHDTADTFRRVRDFVLENRVVSKYSIVTPFPGTRLYDALARQGRIRPGLGWDRYNFLNVVFDTKMPADELCNHLEWLYRETWPPHFR